MQSPGRVKRAGPSALGWLAIAVLAASLGSVWLSVLKFDVVEADRAFAAGFFGVSLALVAIGVLLITRTPWTLKLAITLCGVAILYASFYALRFTRDGQFRKLWARDGERYEAFIRYAQQQPPLIKGQTPWLEAAINGKEVRAMRLGDDSNPNSVIWFPVSGVLDSQIGLYFVQSQPPPSAWGHLSGNWYYGSLK